MNNVQQIRRLAANTVCRLDPAGPDGANYPPMKLDITAKLFFAILAACALLLGVSSVIGRWQFERSFMGYLNEQGVERMREVLPRVVEGYQRHGDWAFVRDQPDVWFQMMRPVGTQEALNRRSLPVSDQTGAVLRLALLDLDGTRLVGNPDVTLKSIRLPVEVAGRQVGWLAMVPFQQAIAAGDVRFYRDQMRARWAIAAVMLIVAAVLAGLLSRALSGRVRGLTGAIHRLAAGDYATRIAPVGDDELGRLAQDVNRLADTLDGIEQNRRTFMADISHELRTPLAVLRAELEAIQDGIRPMTPATLAPLQGEVQQLGKLIDDLYELATTQSGEISYRFARIDLDGALQAAVAGMRGRFADAGLALEADAVPLPLLVWGDERRLQQLFANLLENALRYTDRGGRVVAKLRGVEGGVEAVIEDSAPGVAEDKHARLFERFYRVEGSRNRASGGSGLGLAICRNIVQAHAGTIRAEASPLGGLRVVVSLPAGH